MKRLDIEKTLQEQIPPGTLVRTLGETFTTRKSRTFSSVIVSKGELMVILQIADSSEVNDTFVFGQAIYVELYRPTDSMTLRKHFDNFSTNQVKAVLAFGERFEVIEP